MKSEFMVGLLILSSFFLYDLSSRAAGNFTYENARFSFGVAYSSEVFQPGVESENADGITVDSRDGLAKMLVYGSYAPGTLGLTLEQIYDEERHNPARRVTYQKLSKAGKCFVVSGYEDGIIFYIKSYVLGDTQLVLDIRYPETARDPYDGMVTAISKSFRPMTNE